MPRHLVPTLAGAALVSLPGGVVEEASAPPAVPAPPAETLVAAAEPAEETEELRDPQVERIALFLARRRTGLSEFEIEPLARKIVAEARRHGIDPGLVMALMHVESRFDAFAVSPVGALGLMQILPSTGEEVAHREGVEWRGAQTLFDPLVNVQLGVAYLKELASRYGDVPTALAAYNWGPGHIDRRLRRGRTLPKVYPRLVLEARASTPQGDLSS